MSVHLWFDQMVKWLGFTESWTSLESGWSLTNLINSDRVTQPLSKDVNFVNYNFDVTINVNYVTFIKTDVYRQHYSMNSRLIYMSCKLSLERELMELAAQIMKQRQRNIIINIRCPQMAPTMRDKISLWITRSKDINYSQIWIPWTR